MAKKWTVTPDDYVTNNNNGTFIFPKNEGDTPNVYTIKFEDENGITANTTYTVNPCACTLYSTVPETGIVIYSTGRYSFVAFSYNDEIGVSGNQIVPNVKLDNGSDEDNYIHIDGITESSSPYGLYNVNYTVKQYPPSDYITYFVLTNECHTDEVKVKITVKGSNVLPVSVTERECETSYVFRLNESGARITDVNVVTSSPYFTIDGREDTAITGNCKGFYKVNNSTPATGTATVNTKDSNGREYSNEVTFSSKWAFNTRCEVQFTNTPTMQPSEANSKTHVYVILEFCPRDTTSPDWARDVQELSTYVTSPLVIVFGYTYWSSETKVERISFTKVIPAETIKEIIRNMTTSNLTIAHVIDENTLPNAYFGEGHTKAYCLSVRAVLTAFNKAIHRGDDCVKYLEPETGPCT